MGDFQEFGTVPKNLLKWTFDTAFPGAYIVCSAGARLVEEA
jgi:hypothetical protein